MIKGFKSLALVGAAAGALALGGAAHAQDLKIGALMPMTGDLQAYGESDLQGIQLAADEINEAGGVNGGQVRVVVGNTETLPQAGVDAAQKLVNIENVSGIVGALSSGVTIPVAKSVSSKAGVPQISNASTSPTITTLDDGDFLFRTVPSDAFQGVKLAELVLEKGLTKVGIIYVNNAYGQGLAETFADTYKGMGGSVSANIAYEQGNPSYRGEVQKAAEGGAEGLVLIGYPETGSVIIRQALEGGHFDQFIFTDGLKAPELIDMIGGNYLDGSFGTVPQSPESAGLAHFRAAYEAKHGELPPKPFIDTAYDATYLLALAAEKAGSNDPTAVRDALRSVATPPGTKVGPGEFAKAKELIAAGEEINYEGAAGPQDFDDNGDVPGVIGHWEIQNGEIVDVKMMQ